MAHQAPSRGVLDGKASFSTNFYKFLSSIPLAMIIMQLFSVVKASRMILKRQRKATATIQMVWGTHILTTS